MPKIKIDKLPSFQKEGLSCPDGECPDAKGENCIPCLKPFKQKQELYSKDLTSFNAIKASTKFKPPPAPKIYNQTPKEKETLLNKAAKVTDPLVAFATYASPLLDRFDNSQQINTIEMGLPDNMYTARERDLGVTDINTGVQKPNIKSAFSPYGMYQAEQGGEFSKTKRIQIEEAPSYEKMVYGGQTKYGLDITTKNKSISEYSTPDMSENYKSSISESESDINRLKKLEAEQGEVLWKPGDSTSFLIGGKPHSEGGTKLSANQVDSKNKEDIPSFIFSKHRSMFINPEVAKKEFGINTNKKISPAAIALKFPLNEWTAILNDPKSTKIDKDTAMLNRDKSTKALAKLSVIHESIKGEQPPQFAMEMLGELPTAKLGGYIGNNGLPKFQTTGKVPINAKDKLTEDQHRELIAAYDQAERTKKGPDVLAFQKLYHKYMPNTAYDIIMDDPRVTTRGLMKLGIKNKAELKNATPDKVRETNEDEIFGVRTKQYRSHIPDFEKIPAPNIEVPKDKEKEKEGAKPIKFICVPDERGNGVVRVSTTGIGYDSREEAQQNCIPAKLPPFGFTTPDKLNMIGTAMMSPIQIPPFAPNLAYEPQRYLFKDWRNAAANIFGTQYAAPAGTVAAYTAPQGITSNLSYLAGQAATNIAGAISNTMGENVTIANQAEAANAQRKQQADLFNLGQAEKRYQGYATMKQQYRNEMAKYIHDNVQAYTTAWKNRGDLYDSNMLTNYYKDPKTYKTIFKGQPSNIFGTDYSFPGENSETTNKFGTYYNQFYKSLGTLPEEKRVNQAIKMANKMLGIDTEKS